jgi:hypothetical protein
MLRTFYLWAGFLFLVTARTSAQGKTEIRVSLNRDKIAIGEELVYSVEIKYPNKTKLLGDPVTDFKNFEVTQIRKYEPIEESGFQTLRYDYGLTTFTLDTFVIAGPKMAYLSGRDTTMAQGLSRTVIVAATIDSTVKDIRPEKSFIKSEVNWWLLAFYIVGGIFLVVALFFIGRRLYRKYKIRKLQKPVDEEPTMKRSPEELALERLERLKDQQLIENDAVKEFHSEVSNIIRMYLEQKFLVQAMESTTAELIYEFRKLNKAEENYMILLRRFLEVCDLVKFAKYQPSSRECYDILNDAFGLVKFMFMKNAEETTGFHVVKK